MTISEAWWHLFTLTGNIEAYLLYRGILEPGDYQEPPARMATNSEMRPQGGR